MTKEQLIEELTKLIQAKETHPCGDDEHCGDCYCACKGMAEVLYNAGYRKVTASRTLIELPCKIGDTIYVVPSEVNFRLNKLFHGGELNRVYKQPVSSISVYPHDIVIHTCDGVEMVCMKMYGECWFLTKEEANKRLEELENANM